MRTGKLLFFNADDHASLRLRTYIRTRGHRAPNVSLLLLSSQNPQPTSVSVLMSSFIFLSREYVCASTANGRLFHTSTPFIKDNNVHHTSISQHMYASCVVQCCMCLLCGPGRTKGADQVPYQLMTRMNGMWSAPLLPMCPVGALPPFHGGNVMSHCASIQVERCRVWRKSRQLIYQVYRYTRMQTTGCPGFLHDLCRHASLLKYSCVLLVVNQV